MYGVGFGYGAIGATTILKSGGAFDADAQSFFAASGITDLTQKNAVNQLVLDLKVGNVWSGFSIIRPFIGGNAASHSVNLKNISAYQATFYGGVTHDSNGINGNGTNGYMANNYDYIGANKDSFSSGFYARGAGTNFWFGATQQSRVEIYNEPNVFYWTVTNDNETFLSGQTNADKKGLYVVNRDSSNSKKLYKNSSVISSATDVSTSFPTTDIFVLARSTSSGASLYSTASCSFFFIGRSFNSSEQTIINNAVTAFQTALGRNI